jgi:hypothetical protein
VGLLGPSLAFFVNVKWRRRSFTLANSEVVTMYSGRLGRIRAISF